MATDVDNILRRLEGPESHRRAAYLWKKAHLQMQSANSESIGRDMYIDILRWSARSIMYRLEITDNLDSCWPSYRELFTDALLSFGTSGTKSILNHCERIFTLVLEYPCTPRNLFFEYLHCLSAQRHQREATTAGQTQRAAPLKPKLEGMSTAVAIVPSIPLEEAKRYINMLPDRLTFSLTSGIVRLRLANPLRIPEAAYITSGYTCDTCYMCRLFVGYEAMLYDDKENRVRSSAQLKSQSDVLGFDMCVACALYFYREATHRLAYAIRHPSLRVEVGSTASVNVCSVNTTETSVAMTVCFLPWGAQPIAWVLKAGDNSPPPTWKSQLTWTSENFYELSESLGRTAEDLCVVCLQPLSNGAPVIETTCAHWFHIECIQELKRMVTDECPICRHKGVMPDSVSLACERNVYRLVLLTPEVSQEFTVVIGALLTANGIYENPTNIAACTSIKVSR